MQVPVNVGDHRDAHRSGRSLAKAVGGLALVAAWVAAAVFLSRTKVPRLNLPNVEASDYFPPAELERIDAFRTATRSLWLGATTVELVVLGLVVWKARPLAALVARGVRGRVRTAVVVGLVTLTAVWLSVLPVDAASHWWRRRYGLSGQGYEGWLRDEMVSLGVRAVLVSVAVAGAVTLATRLGRRWWLAGAPALVLVGVVLVLAQPLVIEPLFNRFAPLPDRRLARDVEALARRMHVRIETVQVTDASRRTTAPNAYVAGIGPTRRVVFYDTILDGRFSNDELVAIAAHELAHVGRRHIWKGLGWFALLAVPGVALVAAVTDRRGGLRDPALVPLALLVGVAFALVTLPLQNAVSRRYEAEADWLALSATRRPETVVALERRLVLTSLGDPDPPAWTRVVLATHPPAVERIAMAKEFERLEEPSRREAARGGS
jgi:STE24 endopeptidase